MTTRELTKTLYHGTDATLSVVMNNPKMQRHANGYGFYMTDCIHTARMYGEVIAFEVSFDFEPDVMRFIGEDFPNKLEFIINSQATMIKFLRELEDVYHERYTTPY